MIVDEGVNKGKNGFDKLKSHFTCHLASIAVCPSLHVLWFGCEKIDMSLKEIECGRDVKEGQIGKLITRKLWVV